MFQNKKSCFLVFCAYTAVPYFETKGDKVNTAEPLENL